MRAAGLAPVNSVTSGVSGASGAVAAKARQAKAAGGVAGKGGGRTDAGNVVSYINGTTLLKKLRTEGAQLSKCIAARAGSSSSSGEGGGDASAATSRPLSPGLWQDCTTLACTWYECVLGIPDDV